MGNKDYRKFSDNSNNNPVINTEELGKNIMPTPPITNNELQINESNVLNITPVNEVPKDVNIFNGVNIVETPKAPEDVKPVNNNPAPKHVEGVVVNCARLNVRKEPSKAAKVLRVFEKGNIVMVDLENSTEDFYKVLTPSGEGYCMKDFIEVK